MSLRALEIISKNFCFSFFVFEGDFVLLLNWSIFTGILESLKYYFYVTIQVLRMRCCNCLHVKYCTCFYWLKIFHLIVRIVLWSMSRIVHKGFNVCSAWIKNTKSEQSLQIRPLKLSNPCCFFFTEYTPAKSYNKVRIVEMKRNTKPHTHMVTKG